MRRLLLLAALAPACAHAPGSPVNPDLLERLPQILRGRAWTIEARAEARPFRTGETDAEIFDRARGVLYVYAATVARSREDAQAELERAVLASALYAHDADARWSERVAWRSINSWRGAMTTVMAPLPHAANESPLGYADARGRSSARWDLASFAAAYYASDPKIRCRLLAQTRFLEDRLREAGVEVEGTRCPDFERWAQLEGIEGLEIALAAPTTASIGSLFGHVFLRLIEDRGRVIAFLAESRGVLEDDPLYPLKGIFGAYRAALFEKTFLDVYRDYVVIESRNIRRWRVNLSRAELERFLELVYTRLFTAHYSYYFFAQNCATLSVDLFNGIRADGGRVKIDGSLGQGPASVLDALAFAKNEDGTPLVTYVPEPFLSFQGEALRAQRERLEISARIRANAPALERPLETVESAADPRRRAPAYEEIARVLAEDPAIDAQDAAKWLRASADVESHLSAHDNLKQEEAIAKARKKERRAVLSAYRESLPIELGPRGEAALAMLDESEEARRFEGYRAIAALLPELGVQHASSLRLYALLKADQENDVIRRIDVRLHNALFQPDRALPVVEQDFARGFERLVDYTYVTEISPALLAVQRGKQAVAVKRNAVREDDGGLARAHREDQRYQESYGHTGVDMFGVGASIARGGSPALLLRGAAYEELLGDQRRHGFPAFTAFTFLKSEAAWGYARGRLPYVERSETRAVGYRSIEPSRLFGYELYADLFADRRALSPRAGAGGLFPILVSDDYSDHLLASLGLAYEATFPGEGPDVHGLAVPIGLEVRKALGGPIHALRGSAGARPMYDVLSRRFAVAYRAAAELRVLIAERANVWIDDDVGLAVIARARWQREDADQLIFDVGITFE